MQEPLRRVTWLPMTRVSHLSMAFRDKLHKKIAFFNIALNAKNKVYNCAPEMPCWTKEKCIAITMQLLNFLLKKSLFEPHPLFPSSYWLFNISLVDHSFKAVVMFYRPAVQISAWISFFAEGRKQEYHKKTPQNQIEIDKYQQTYTEPWDSLSRRISRRRQWWMTSLRPQDIRFSSWMEAGTKTEIKIWVTLDCRLTRKHTCKLC